MALCAPRTKTQPWCAHRLDRGLWVRHQPTERHDRGGSLTLHWFCAPGGVRSFWRDGCAIYNCAEARIGLEARTRGVLDLGVGREGLLLGRVIDLASIRALCRIPESGVGRGGEIVRRSAIAQDYDPKRCIYRPDGHL